MVGGTAFAGDEAYARWRPEPVPAAPVQTATAATRSIVERTSLAGSVAAGRSTRLSFSAGPNGANVSGKVTALNVRTGDTVKAGQELARIDTTNLDTAVSSARIALTVAELKMQDLIKGALAADVATAQQTVLNTQVALAKAETDLETLQKGPTAGDIAGATQAVLTAQTSVQNTQNTLNDLQARINVSADLAAKKKVLDENAVQINEARRVYEDAIGPQQDDALRAAAFRAEQSVTTLCNEGHQDQCRAAAAGVTSFGSLTDAIAKAVGANVSFDLLSTSRAFEIQTARKANGPAISSGLAKVLQLQIERMKLNADYNALNATSAASGPPTQDALAAAQRANETAKASLTEALGKRDTVVAGPTATAMQSAKNTVEAAKVALLAATSKRDTLLGGPLPLDLASQEQSLLAARTAYTKALNDQAGAVMVAPFDGVVGTITLILGELSGSNTIVLIDPSSLQLNATSQEADVGKLKPGQNVNLTFDAYQGVTVTGRVASVAPAAEVTQGVASYAVVVEIQRPTGAAAAAAAARNFELRAGMAGTASVEITRYDNVLAVPSRAVRRSGRTQTVEVLVNGVAEVRTVRTGASDGSFTQILEGLQPGDVVTIASTTTGAAGATSASATATVGAGAPPFGGGGSGSGGGQNAIVVPGGH